MCAARQNMLAKQVRFACRALPDQRTRRKPIFKTRLPFPGSACGKTAIDALTDFVEPFAPRRLGSVLA